MKSWILHIALALAVTLAGSYAVYSISYADGAASVAPMDAGPAEQVVTTPSLGQGDVDDPLDSPSGFWGDLNSARRNGWPAVVIVALFALLRLARGRFAWLREGRKAAISASAIVLLGALVDWQAGGADLLVVVAAALSSIALLLNPQPPAVADNTRFQPKVPA